jgi:hypothetical protein
MKRFFCGLFLFALGFGKGFVGGECDSFKLQETRVETVSNPKTPVPPVGHRKRLVFKEELSIGMKEGDERYMLVVSNDVRNFGAIISLFS